MANGNIKRLQSRLVRAFQSLQPHYIVIKIGDGRRTYCSIAYKVRHEVVCLSTWLYNTLRIWPFYFKAKRLSELVQRGKVQLFFFFFLHPLQNSHYHSKSKKCIGSTWRSKLFQGSYEEVKLVLCMTKQPHTDRLKLGCTH